MESFTQYEPPTTQTCFDVTNNYHVFLSFRGKDVRKKFVDHLYESLSASGLRVFLDSEELKKGEGIDASLKTGIEKSDILIPIFSERYAESTWCLEEAARMCGSKGLIIPLFYDVEPCDVRYPRRTGGKFEKAFQKHYSHLDRQSESTIHNWENALHQISHLSGWTLEEESGYEARLVKRVVKVVLDTLQKNALLDVAMYPIGLERSKRQLVDLLNLSSTNITVSVGISGLGGVGKTTLAKAVYNEIHRTFDACSFLFNIGASAHNGTTLVDLQRRILRDLVKYNGEVSSVDAGKVLMRDRLQGVQALVILDDVTHISQLHAVCGDWFGPGSRLIIISRDRHILHHGKVNSVHEMSGLTEEESLQLFSFHSFSRAFPENPYEDLSPRIAKACGGIPLALIVMGAHLSDKKEPNDIECWKEAVMNIGENPDIFTVLRISYDGLSSVEKEIFLDIACCLLGEKRTEAVIFWEFFYPNKVQTAIKNLSLKMLINMHGHEDLLDMHDLLWQMGRAIQEQSGKYSRLRLPMGPQNDLNTDRAGEVNMLVYTGENRRKPVKLPSMPHLRYLFVQNTKLVGNIGNLAPNLIWIRVKNCEFLSDSHTWRILRNRCQIDNWSQLRIFIVEQCATIKRIPGTLDGLVNLQRLNLVDCSALTTLPNALGNMSQLKKFILCGCASLTRLPDTVGKMEQLKEFYMGGCTNLKSLPSKIGNLAQLRLLNLDGCTNLKILPETVGNLAQLQLLDLSGCTGLQRLPSTVGKLTQLRWLNIHGCSGLGSFKDMIVKLPELRRLNRYNGLGSSIEKRFNVYLGSMARETVDRLYRSLRKTSLRIIRGLEDDQRGNTDRLYSESSKTPNQCTAMCETSADIEKSSETDSVGKIRRLIEEAILKSDILVPVGCTLPKCEKGTILMCNSDALVVPFYVDVESFHDRGDVNPSLIGFAGDMYMEISPQNQDKRTCTLWSVPWDRFE